MEGLVRIVAIGAASVLAAVAAAGAEPSGAPTTTATAAIAATPVAITTPAAAASAAPSAAVATMTPATPPPAVSPSPAATPPALASASPAPGASPAAADAERDAILRVQVTLDRAAFSVGEIDGRAGANTERALRAFQRAHGLAPTGRIDAATDAALAASSAPTLVPYTITPADVAGPFVAIPSDMMAKSKLPAAGWSSPLEALAERVHASPALLEALNPGRRFDGAGESVLVPNVRIGPPAPAARIVVDGADLSVTALAADGQVLARYPASVGSRHDPLPVGTWTVRGVARNPPFHYNPRLFWDAKSSHTRATIAPGPNNPVGVVWVDLSKAHYGIHGTPEPSRISRSESHGCIRLTNWDAMALAEQVKPGMPAVLRR